MYKKIVILFCVLLFGNLNSNGSFLLHKVEKQQLTDTSFNSHHYVIEDTVIVKKGKVDRLNLGVNFPLGATQKWVRLTIQNQDSVAAEIIVELTNPFLKKVRFYTVNTHGVVDSLITGATFEYQHRYKSYPNFLKEISIPGKSHIECVMNIQTGNISGDFKLLVWNKEKRVEYKTVETQYLSYFFVINCSFIFLIGIAILMTRQRYHLYYFLYCLFGFFYIYAEVGLGFKNLWYYWPKFQEVSVFFIANIYQVFGLLFVKKYFKIPNRFKFFDIIFVALVIAGVLCEFFVLGVLIFKTEIPIWFTVFNTVLFMISGISVFIIALIFSRIKNFRSDSIWFLIGFTPHAISILQLCLRPFGLFNSKWELWFKHFVPIYIDTIHPPNLLLWATLWEMVIVFWLMIKRLERLYIENNTMTTQLATQKEKNMNTLLLGIEKERQRIAHELHDGSGVALSALKMKLNILNEKLKGNNQNENIEILMKDVDGIYEDIRNISHNLMPKTLSKLGLFPAIEELINQFKIAAPNIKFSYFRKAEFSFLSDTAKLYLFRIVQELLTNIVKHSQAKEVTLQIIKYNDALMLSMEDDGKGFDRSTKKNGIGLTGIESRIQMLGGELLIDSAPEKGSFISISIPLVNL